MRAPQLLGLAPWLLVLAGCGGVGSSIDRESPVALDEPAFREPGPSQLDVALEEYYAGVRAWVAGDVQEAENRFLQCQQDLALAASEEVAERDARDAEILAAKADYFLDRIADTEGWEDDGGPAVAVEVEEPGASWDVTQGSIEAIRNHHVDRWIDYFTGDGRDVFQRWLDRKSQYEPVIHAAFARHGLPPELEYHAMIESGFSTSAYSWAHAVGIWQFVSGTAKRYGLRCDWWVDERRDPEKSTEAAARYLAELHQEFGDWELALAAYNVGEGRVRQQIRRQNTRDFWQLRLPRETRNHVPKFYAALILGSDPEAWGFSVNRSELPASESVQLDFTVDFDALADCAGTDDRTIAALNPALIRGCTPPDASGYEVRVPAGKGESTQLRIAALPEDQRVRWERHTVRRGDTLSEIAERYGTTVTAVMSANRLRSSHLLRVGQELMIPRGQRSASPPSFASAPSGPSGGSTTYTVRKGDTLSEIAARYRTSVKNIRRWNRVGNTIYPGQKLKIYAKGGSSIASSSGSEYVKVRKGDTLWELARDHGVSLSSLLRANNLGKNSTIRPGDRIRIPRS
ncbi:MAG: LysM peptidoglycan-binding domain-containing protein [bacterium]